ncbi:MAG: radical SAM protein [Candidatus Acidiferrum sp.]|jgi:radical SAM superfamily enzyme YgiQ (UPF0313 family)
MRRYLGEDDSAPIRHPEIVSGLQTRSLGIRLPERCGSVAPTVIPSVGCPMGCNFCTTSSFFGGKGNFYNFYETGDELFELMDGFERSMKVQTFFVMDENFLLHRERAMELLERMKAAGKSWGMAVFASANAIRRYSMKELVELGVSWIWMGLESQSTPENIEDEIERAGSHKTDFHQFMLYTPVPGTPLYFETKKQGRLLDGVDLADIHGQFQFNFEHAAISRADSQKFLDWAFLRDFQRNGPSLYRMCRTMLEGWKRYRDYPNPRVRERFEREMSKLRLGYNAALWAMERQCREWNETVSAQIKGLRGEVEKECVFAAKLNARALGPLLLWTSRR